MNDPERGIRSVVMARLGVPCHCTEHAPIHRLTGELACVDVLCRPRDATLYQMSFAIEVKSHSVIGDRELGPWIKQSADYVGAMPENGWPRVVACFVWLIGLELDTNPDERLRMDGMVQLGQHFRVGRAHDNKASRLTLTFGPSADVYRERTGWTPKAPELLNARRISGGMRKTLT
ncbi:MAG TPA: hypothetical protein VIJ55_17030 [Acetobacteraceae bacterium]